MDKRLMTLLQNRGGQLKDGCMIDTYNQQIQYDVSCTIRTNINTANHHFIVEECNSKENISTPTKVSIGIQHKSSLEDNLGGGISRTVKTTDSLATLVMAEPKAVSYTRDSKGKTQNKHLNEIVNTIHSSTGSGGNTDCLITEPLRIPEATAKGYAEATEGDSVNLEQPNSKTRRGRVGKQMANTLTTSCNQGVVSIEPLNPLKTALVGQSKRSTNKAVVQTLHDKMAWVRQVLCR